MLLLIVLPSVKLSLYSSLIYFFVCSQIFVLIKGPGWTPGKPRLGDPADIPEVS